MGHIHRSSAISITQNGQKRSSILFLFFFLAPQGVVGDAASRCYCLALLLGAAAWRGCWMEFIDNKRLFGFCNNVL